MRWLNSLLRAERGATAVIVGIMLVPLIGCLAIALDVGALYVERAQLQNGADAAALAIAFDCADDEGCGDSAALAADFTNDNANDGAANVLDPDIDLTNQTVTVTDSTRVAGTDQDAIQHPFAALLGITETTVRATATAEWGGPGSAPVLALTLSWCEFQASLADPLQHILIQTDTNRECRHAPSEEIIPGGFGWLDDPSDSCQATLALDPSGELWLGSDTGGNITSDCQSTLTALRDTAVLIPIFDLTRGTGAAAEYRVFAFASFTITGWSFPSTRVNDPDAPECNGNCRGIQGVFTEWVSTDTAIGLGGPELNATQVRLTQ